MPFAAALTGKVWTGANSAVWTGVSKSLPGPPHRYEMLFWLSTVAHAAPFYPGVPSRCHRRRKAPWDVAARTAVTPGCPQHPAEGYECVFPGSCHSAIELCIRSQSYAEDNRVFVGSRSFLLIPIPRSMLPGNRSCRQDFPPLTHDLLHDGQADPTPTPMLPFMPNYSLKFKQHWQRRLRSILIKGMPRPHFLEKLVCKPLQKEITLPGSPTQRLLLPANTSLQTGEGDRQHPLFWFWSLQRAPYSMPPPQISSDKTQSTVPK